MEQWIQYIPWLLVALATFIEITPIKINPVSHILKWVGNQINGEIKEEIETLNKTMDQNEIDRIRYEILDFANSCRNGRHHSKDEFHHVVEINEKYHKLILKNQITNGVLDAEYAYIERIYQECLEKGTLL